MAPPQGIRFLDTRNTIETPPTPRTPGIPLPYVAPGTYRARCEHTGKKYTASNQFLADRIRWTNCHLCPEPVGL